MKASIFERAWKRLIKSVSSFFYLDQWVIMIAPNVGFESLSWMDFKALVPESDRYWADPFILAREDKYYVLIEEKLYETKLGRIACLTLDKEGKLISNQTVLEKPYHLSYPFLFEYRGELYMLPESAANCTLELYRCVNFPDQWEFAQNLMTDIYAVDATLFEHENRYWLFANVKPQGGSSLDALYLFYSDNPLSTKWTPHPLNPVVRSIHSARPGGHIFLKDGKIIRPSQDSARRYGYALQFNQITQLTETEYEEKLIKTFAPPTRSSILATHTWNQAGGKMVIDAVFRRKKTKKLN
jgi:hypothetical protein